MSTKKVKLFEMPVNIVKAACANPDVISIVNNSKSFSLLPLEELIFIFLSVMQSLGKVNQEMLDIMHSFVDAYKGGNIAVDKSPNGANYILYQTGEIKIDIGFAKKHNIQI